MSMISLLSFSKARKALTEAVISGNKAETAKSKADNIQSQLDQLVIDGDSSAEAAQARVREDGKTYGTLLERLNFSDWMLFGYGTNVRDYGAKGDGETDDTQAIIDAINDVPDSGGNVFIPAGKYKITGTLPFKSNLKIEGAGRYNTILMPEGSFSNLFFADGSGDDWINNIELCHIGLNGDNMSDEASSIIRFSYVRGLSAHDLYAENTGQGLIWLRPVEGFQITNIEVKDAPSIPVATFDSKQGVIQNIVVNGAGEAVDFFDTEDVVVSDVYANSPIDDDEVIDIGASRNIIIKGVISSGYSNGITIKQEPASGDSSKYHNIHIDNCILLDFYNVGVQVTGSGSGTMADDPRNIRVTNCTIQSDKPGSQGIRAFGGGGDPVQIMRGLKMAGNLIKTDGKAVNIQYGRMQNLEILESTIESINDDAVYQSNASGVVVDGVKIADNKLKAANGYGARILGAYGVDMHDNDVTKSQDGVLLQNCPKPKFTGNTVRDIGDNAVVFEYTSINNFKGSKVLGINAKDNLIENWGKNSSGSYGIKINFTDSGDGTYDILNIVRNDLIIEGDQNNQYPIGFIAPNIDGFDYVKEVDNTLYNVPNNIQGTELIN